ncbi:MAG: phosphodiester glycosidase family protein [Oscillospiraceae bacterium]|nr:phosphodiester glycosidase family protein [Oscillospiraceae bacterium]
MSREYDVDDILSEYNNGVVGYAPDGDDVYTAAEPEYEPEQEAYTEPEGNFYEDEPEDGFAEDGYDEAAEEDEYGPEPEAEEDAASEEAASDSGKSAGKKPIEFTPKSSGTGTAKKRRKRAKKESAGARLGFGLLSLIFMAVSAVVLAWSLQNLHPEAGASSESTKPAGSTDLVARLESGLNNAKASALSDITYIPKHYSIPETDTVAPRPNEANFGSVNPANAAAVMDIIQQARDSGLLEGQDVIFSPALNFRQDTDIQYYLDDTILTILWKEIIDGNTVTCCEVKVADASQFRRKIVDDTFGSGNQLYATSIAASVNSVVAMNADFYMFRDFGIVVYDRELYRFGEATYTGNYKKYNCTDTLFIDEDGDFHFWHKLQEATQEQMKEYIRQNNITFSIAFGPILVEDGVLTPCDWYPAGEIDRGYSRAGIGQKDHLHYFYMSLNHSAEREARWNVNQFGQRMYERGLQQAYCLDGGQTSEIVWRGAPFNYIDFGAERLVSDIIYFATAIPETEGRQ